ncbi:hypothetical protein [Mesorhizobium metallidurans]|uniref:hypothetical protein n=1 Tax=Mesorhizobium metallidurans TaxID=489722 RepID=UPI001427EB11|nr:hypothetical protein [Mesorhizobium metallidurans]
MAISLPLSMSHSRAVPCGNRRDDARGTEDSQTHGRESFAGSLAAMHQIRRGKACRADRQEENCKQPVDNPVHWFLPQAGSGDRPPCWSYFNILAEFFAKLSTETTRGDNIFSSRIWPLGLENKPRWRIYTVAREYPDTQSAISETFAWRGTGR